MKRIFLSSCGIYWHLSFIEQGKKITGKKTPIVLPRPHCLVSERINDCPNFSLFCEVLEGQTICMADAVDALLPSVISTTDCT